MITWLLDRADWPSAIGVLLLQNLLIFALAVGGGAMVMRIFPRAIAMPGPAEPREWWVAAGTVLLNTAVTAAGLWLYRRGIVRFRTDTGWRAWLDVAVLLLIMDSAMYVLHRVVHHQPFYKWFHELHHRYQNPRPLTLFVLSPQETLAFGGLWLVVIMVYPASWLGMSVYLALNVFFGVIGHTGIAWRPSVFHLDHHADPSRNFGFYTPLWDWLFRTAK
jgi:sterol desaturase/sphingolipid hydroxylase (fatty acid hydroxylase superfamily)